MFGFDEARDAHQQVYGDGGYDNQGSGDGGYDNQGSGDGGYDNKAKFSHEVISGGAAFEGMKLFEDHQRKEGKPVSHQFAKELLAGFVGGEVDKLAETKGMNEYDTYEAKKRATAGANQMYDEHYIQGQGADQYDPNQYQQPNFNY